MILDAKHIDLSDAIRFKSEADRTIKSDAHSLNSSAPKNTANNNIYNGSTNYKLCICLSAGNRAAHRNGKTESKRSNEVIAGAQERNGFVFGVRADLGLSCANFSSVYC